MLRTDWHQLPLGARSAIEAQAGAVLNATTASEGLNSEVAATLHLENGKKVFLKGLRVDHPGVATQHREAMIAPFVGEVTPRLLWQIEADGWNFLAFDHVDARHADYSPGSADIQRTVDAIGVLGKITCPDLPLKQAEKRWGAYVDSEFERGMLHGDALLHTDYNPPNVLITEADTYLVDWAWPTRGAAWIDPACLVVRLIDAGNSPAQAESWAGQTLAWSEAPPEALDMFSRASWRMWDQIAGHDPAEWKSNVVAAAKAWMDHRAARSNA